MTPTLASLPAIALPAGLALVGVLTGFVIQRTVLTRLARAATRTRSRADDMAIAALRGPVVLWCTMLGLYAAIQVTTLPPKLSGVVERGLVVLLIISITWSVAQLAGDLVRHRARAAGADLPSTHLITNTRLISNLAKAVVVTIGGLVLLETVGTSITPLITALGVGGLAVGLALQDTLANLFAGIHLLLSRQLRPGDFVRLSSGEEGFVEDVTWRYTTIRQLPNNLTIVPNKKLASAVTANFNLPNPEQGVLVDVGVSYSSDLGHVERVTVEVGQEVMREVEGGVPEFTPFIRYHTFADSSIQFTVNLQGKHYVSQYLIKHEFIKRLHERYHAEGIEIPLSSRKVQVLPSTED